MPRKNMITQLGAERSMTVRHDASSGRTACAMHSVFAMARVAADRRASGDENGAQAH